MIDRIGRLLFITIAGFSVWGLALHGYTPLALGLIAILAASAESKP